MSGREGLRIAVYSGAELLGDGLFKMPFLRSLRATFPDAEILWITTGKTVYAGVLKEIAAPFISHILENTGLVTSIREILVPRRINTDGDIDILIDTQTNLWRSLALKRALRPRLFVASSADYLFSDVKPSQVNPHWTKTKPPHFVDSLLRLIDLVSHGNAKLTDGEIAIPEAFISLANTLLPSTRRYVGFAPGSGDPTKRWPLERFITLAIEIRDRGYTPVFFIGPNERFMLSEIRQKVPDALFPEDQVPESTQKGPLLVAALGRRLEAAVANDSGLGHMLSLSSIPLVLLYGRHSPLKYAPRIQSLYYFWAQDFGSTDHEAIPLKNVAAALNAALNASPAGRADCCAS